jgi:hypothetical protein
VTTRSAPAQKGATRATWVTPTLPHVHLGILVEGDPTSTKDVAHVTDVAWWLIKKEPTKVDGCNFMFRQYTEDIFLQSVRSEPRTLPPSLNAT